MGPAEASQAVSIRLRNCYVARFGHPLEASKASKSPQQLSKAFEPQNPPQQLAKASRLLCHGTSRGPTSCFYWASKLLRGTFWAPLRNFKSFKSPEAAFEGLWTAKASAAACEGVLPALPWYLPRSTSCFYWASKLLRGTFSATSRGPASCFYWASKLLRGTFWALPKSFKSLKISAAAFEGLWPAKRSAAACEGVPPALPWDLPRPHKLFLLGFETATWHVFGYMYLFIYSFIHLFL